MAAIAAALLSACGSGGGGGGGGGPPPTTVTISGQITFDRIPFDAVLGNGLNPAAIVQAPARQVTVQAIGPAGTALATGTTDTSGNYSLTVPANTNVFIRARAEMIKTGTAPTWNFSVRDNTTVGANDALYAIDGAVANSGTTNSTRNLNAPSGFSGTTYTGTRAAAPFAILDTVFRAKELVLAAAPNTDFPELRLFWSPNNRPTVDRFCPDDGDISTSSYIVFPAGLPDDCGKTNADGIYILGDFAGGNGDTDEFDQSVIAHEFGHYFEDRFGRSDSLGGDHGNDIPLDLRVAFSEGWGNAFSGMALGDSLYRDSQLGVQDEFGFDMEADLAGGGLNEGWYSELSVGEILWDLFDSTNEAGDGVAFGFGPLYSAMTGPQRATDALTSIFSFISGLRAAQPGSSAAINALLSGENIANTDEFGTDESNAGGGDSAVLPIYRNIMLNGGQISVCSRSPFGNVSSNKLGNRVFLRFNNNAQRLVTIRAQGFPYGGGTVAAEDPDIFVLRRGELAALGVEVGGTETISQVPLPAGLYIIEVYDFQIDRVGGGTQPRCMTVSITGP